ncbi:MAG TPA: CPBP family intramembrane glutamic endopeptidase [Gemmataceae bacterium]|nr:CPBP family intramembrane glutamic endopeptidase [Gemmataceae bacterium]
MARLPIFCSEPMRVSPSTHERVPFKLNQSHPMDTAIGATLNASPRLLWFTILAAVFIVGADMASIPFGPYLGLDETFRFTLALLGALSCAFVSSAKPLTGGTTFGLRVAPRQGWWYWVRVSAVIGAALFVVLLCTGVGLVALGHPLPEPRIKSPSEVWPLFLVMCVIAPLSEEVVYRLVFCPPSAALLGARCCVILNGVVFAGLHFLYGNPSPENLLGGFILSWAFLKSETLVVPVLLHAGGNTCAFLANVAYYYWWQGRPL